MSRSREYGHRNRSRCRRLPPQKGRSCRDALQRSRWTMQKLRGRTNCILYRRESVHLSLPPSLPSFLPSSPLPSPLPSPTTYFTPPTNIPILEVSPAAHTATWPWVPTKADKPNTYVSHTQISTASLSPPAPNTKQTSFSSPISSRPDGMVLCSPVSRPASPSLYLVLGPWG